MTISRESRLYCQKCNGKVKEIECLDVSIGLKQVDVFKKGICNCCGSIYEWKETFYFNYHTIIKKD